MGAGSWGIWPLETKVSAHRAVVGQGSLAHDVCGCMGVRLGVTAAKAKVTALGGVDLVVAAMGRHLDAAEVQAVGSTALQVLATDDAGA